MDIIPADLSVLGLLLTGSRLVCQKNGNGAGLSRMSKAEAAA